MTPPRLPTDRQPTGCDTPQRRRPTVMTTCPSPAEFHTAHFTLLGQLAYGTRLPLWRVIPHRWVTRPCCAAVSPYPDGTRAAS